MDEARLKDILARNGKSDGPLLPILHEVQEAFGCIDRQAEATIAEALNLSRAEVHGVVSFYHDFLAQPDPRPVVQICRAEACQARGVGKLVEHAEAVAGERVKIGEVYCLGLCSIGPNARVGDRLFSRLDTDLLTRIVEQS